MKTHLIQAARAALQWRLLLLWCGVTLLPSLVLALPVWQYLNVLSHSVLAPELAVSLNHPALADLIHGFREQGGGVRNGALLSAVLALLLSPLLCGSVITAARSRQTLGFRALWSGGLAEYPRLLRTLIWAIVPVGLALGAAQGLHSLAESHGEKAVLASSAENVALLATIASVVLLAFANLTLDAGRAALAIDKRRSSAVKGWWRGLKLLARYPGAVLGLYLALSLGGLLLAGLLGIARVNVPTGQIVGFIGGLLLTQAIVLVLAWMRSARLFALIALAHADDVRHGGGVAKAAKVKAPAIESIDA
ncbi:hypothetical protein [Massilia sp. BJB1822]|uniref:hypothetical protein n=1 Tax=Massilia sp. BJB1822 TaxID=2744470 RepID=UPI0015945736|nr:hypothetical protein [Massilia sp. BJB1822]NVE00057.1 hypothetical protein [Massilia sp. BJB1822]